VDAGARWLVDEGDRKAQPTAQRVTHVNIHGGGRQSHAVHQSIDCYPICAKPVSAAALLLSAMLAAPNQLLNSEIQCLTTTQGRPPSPAAEARVSLALTSAVVLAAAELLCSARLVTCCWVCLAHRPARHPCSRPFSSSGSLPSHVNCMPQPRLDHCSVTAASTLHGLVRASKTPAPGQAAEVAHSHAAAPEVHNEVTMEVAGPTQQQPRKAAAAGTPPGPQGRPDSEAFRVQGSTALSLRKYTLGAWMLTPAGLLLCRH
jgi:hypothetical protein